MELTCNKNDKNENIFIEKRQSNLELLRIISIIMIIMHHYALYSGFTWKNEITANALIINFFLMFGKLGALVFVIISGYFYDKTKFKIKKLITLLVQVWIISIIGLIIGVITDSEKLNIINIIKSIFPVSFSVYWFASCYILLYIFIPFLKKIIINICKKDFKILLTIMIGIWFIYANIPGVEVFSSNFILFVTIYLIGGYIKKYNINFLTNKKRVLTLTFFIALMYLIMLVIQVVSIKVPFLQNKWSYFNGQRSPLVLVLAVIFLVTFKNWNIKSSKIINKIASTTFGIYLIHENFFTKDIIWKQIVKGNEFINSPLLILNAILGVLGVFIVSMIIYIIVEKLIINNLLKIFSKIYSRLRCTKKYMYLKEKLVKYYNS